MTRILSYMILAAVLYFVASFFIESQIGFVIVFGLGLAIGLCADLLFLTRLVRIPWLRRSH